MNLTDLGFMYMGHCACPRKPERWVHEKKLEVKTYKDGHWKLLHRDYRVRFGKLQSSMIAEIEEYMNKNNI